jgi:hypothetical protein
VTRKPWNIEIMIRLVRFLALTAAFVATTATAASRITFYELEDFRGKSFTATNGMENLPVGMLGGKVASIVVAAGSWQLCTGASFGGKCVTLATGEYQSLGGLGIGNGVLSARTIDDIGIALYDLRSYRSRKVVLEASTPELASLKFDRRASSAIVYSGVWEVCDKADYDGECVLLESGRYPDLGAMSNRVNSVRLVAATPPAGETKGVGTAPAAGARATLFEHRNMAGRSFVLTDEVVSDLTKSGFNDRASSLRIQGGFWIFCSGAGFMGECRTFGPGEYAQLPWSADNRILSGRRISEYLPYSGIPRWGPR